MDKLYFFRIANRLNFENHRELRSKKLYFRANRESFSLISTNHEFPEVGIGKLFTSDDGINALKYFEWRMPKSSQDEKKLQAWIIDSALDNNNRFCFERHCFTFLTSELIFPAEGTNGIRNDILAMDNQNSLVIIELKYKRLNKVKKQAIDYANLVIKPNKEFFNDIIKLLLNVKWSGKIRKIAVWEKPTGRNRERTFLDVEEVWFEVLDNSLGYKFTCDYIGTESNSVS